MYDPLYLQQKEHSCKILYILTGHEEELAHAKILDDASSSTNAVETYHHEGRIEVPSVTLNNGEKYEGCSNMNASGFITFFTYMLRQNSNRFYKGLYVTFKVLSDLKTNTVYLSSYSPLNEGHVCILTNSMLQTYTVIETSV